MSCLKTKNWIFDHLVGNLEPMAKESIEEHLRTCKDCRKTFEDFKLIEKLFKENLRPKRIEVPLDFIDRVKLKIHSRKTKLIRFMIYKVAALILIAIGVGTLISKGIIKKEMHPETSKKSEATKKNLQKIHVSSSSWELAYQDTTISNAINMLGEEIRYIKWKMGPSRVSYFERSLNNVKERIYELKGKIKENKKEKGGEDGRLDFEGRKTGSWS